MRGAASEPGLRQILWMRDSCEKGAGMRDQDPHSSQRLAQTIFLNLFKTLTALGVYQVKKSSL